LDAELKQERDVKTVLENGYYSAGELAELQGHSV